MGLYLMFIILSNQDDKDNADDDDLLIKGILSQKM